jgi:predicted O-methyltransferase YrrM
MNDREISRKPGAVVTIQQETDALGFAMASEPKTGALLAALATSKPGGRFLELGTGTGLGTAWLLAGMDRDARLDTVESDPAVAAVARRHLATDSRVTFHVMDATDFIGQSAPNHFDLVYADAWPGKFSQLDETLRLLRVGGIYFIDDLLPQPSWPDEHAPKVRALIDALECRPGYTTVKLAWASGLMLVVRAVEKSPAMSTTHEVLAEAYKAFNDRDVDRALEAMHPDVDWANGMEGGHVHGRPAVREYWTRQWSQIDPHVEPQRFTTDDGGRTVVDVHQIVRDLAGRVLSDRMVQHIYVIQNGLVLRMDIGE